MKKAGMFLAVCLAASAGNADGYYSSCQYALQDAQNLALYNTYGERSIKSDVDRIQRISERIERSLRSLEYISGNSRQVNELAGNIGQALDGGMVPKIQAAYNHNVNAQRILESALQKYESALASKGLGDVTNHIRNALSQARQTESNAQGAERDANGVKGKAQRIEASIRGETQNIARYVRDQASDLQGCNSDIQWITDRLVGSGYNWGGYVDPRSKLGRLENILGYLEQNSCIRD